jgi:DNA-directed RNA polymerase specialized sigma24 family protein
MEEERAWIEQALGGDRAAFGQLVRAYERPVYNLAYRMLGNPAEAEDAAQETFLRASTKLATSRGASSSTGCCPSLRTIASIVCVERVAPLSFR